MKRIFGAFFGVFFGLTLVAVDAEAARLGGKRSAGMQRSNIVKREAPPANQTAAPAPRAGQPAATPQPSGMSRFMGPLAGLAAGLGLAALFSHLGMGAGFSSMIMMLLLAAAAFFVIRMLFARKQTPAPMQYAGNVPTSYTPTPSAHNAGSNVSAITSAAETTASIPADFDVDGFLRQAKLNFVRLQAANDAKNIEDVRDFTTPEMYAEIKLDMNERGDTPQQTDVVTLNATLLDLTSEATQHIASVRFSGSIRESDATTAPAPFNEVWHLSKPVDGSRGWVIAGIEQIN